MKISAGLLFRVGKEAEGEHDKDTNMEPRNDGYISLHGSAEGRKYFKFSCINFVGGQCLWVIKVLVWNVLSPPPDVALFYITPSICHVVLLPPSTKNQEDCSGWSLLSYILHSQYPTVWSNTLWAQNISYLVCLLRYISFVKCNVGNSMLTGKVRPCF